MKANELLDKALNFIVETQENNDYICEQMCEDFVGDYCEKNCQNLNKDCVKLFLQKVYNKEKVMKANEAPEKIYMTPSFGEPDNILLASFSKSHLNFHRDIEYTRTDSFLEKACEWLKEYAYFFVNDYTGSLNEDLLIGEFRNYMKGE